MHYLVELIVCYPDHTWNTRITPCVDADDSDDAGQQAIDAFPNNIETAFIGVYYVETVESICPHCGETISNFDETESTFIGVIHTSCADEAEIGGNIIR